MPRNRVTLQLRNSQLAEWRKVSAEAKARAKAKAKFFFRRPNQRVWDTVAHLGHLRRLPRREDEEDEDDHQDPDARGSGD